MLGMTAGAVWAYLHRERVESAPLSVTLTNFTLATAIAMPASIIVQFCLITTISLSLTTVFSWGILMVAMAVPYFFSGVVVSLALTRSPFPAGQVYGMDLVGAALGCLGVIFVLNIMDGPTAVLFRGRVRRISCRLHVQRQRRRSTALEIGSLVASSRADHHRFTCLRHSQFTAPVGVRPILVKDQLERTGFKRYEKWNSYSRITVDRPLLRFPIFGRLPKMSAEARAMQATVVDRRWFWYADVPL